MMKHLLIATAALSLLGGAALAQASDPNNPNGNPISDSTAPAGVTKGGPAAAGDPVQPADGSTQAPQSPAASPADASAAPATAAAADSSSTTMASNTGADAPPASYPVCTSKHEDRCVNRSQATRMASNAMRSHRMKATTSATGASDQAAAPAAPGS